MAFSLLVRRGPTYYFRRAVPVALRLIVGKREILVSLRTTDLQEAKSRATGEAVKADRLLWQARQTLQNPSAAVHAIAQELVREDAQARLGVLPDDDEVETESMAISDELERLFEKKPKKLHDAIQVRARIQALQTILRKLEAGGAAVPEDPPLSVIFDRWRGERKPSEKTWREFDLSRRRFIEVNGDLSVRSITKNHVRAMKTALLGMKSSKPR